MSRRILFSQRYIHQYPDTKAAAYTMVDRLLEAAGIDGSELSHVYLSGAFPAHSDLKRFPSASEFITEIGEKTW